MPASVKIDASGFDQAAAQLDQAAARMDAEIARANAEIGAMMVTTSVQEIHKRAKRRTGRMLAGETHRIEGRKVRIVNAVYYSRFVAAKKGDWHKASARRRARVIRRHYLGAIRRALGTTE